MEFLQRGEVKDMKPMKTITSLLFEEKNFQLAYRQTLFIKDQLKRGAG